MIYKRLTLFLFLFFSQFKGSWLGNKNKEQAHSRNSSVMSENNLSPRKKMNKSEKKIFTHLATEKQKSGFLSTTNVVCSLLGKVASDVGRNEAEIEANQIGIEANQIDIQANQRNIEANQRNIQANEMQADLYKLFTSFTFFYENLLLPIIVVIIIFSIFIDFCKIQLFSY